MEDKDLYGKDLPAPPKDRNCRTWRLVGEVPVGALDYALGGHPLWEIFRTVYQMSKRPYVIGGLTLLVGYVTASIKHAQRPVSDELVAFRRREQMKRLKKFLLGGKQPQSELPAGS